MDASESSDGSGAPDPVDHTEERHLERARGRQALPMGFGFGIATAVVWLIVTRRSPSLCAPINITPSILRSANWRLSKTTKAKTKTTDDHARSSAKEPNDRFEAA